MYFKTEFALNNNILYTINDINLWFLQYNTCTCIIHHCIVLSAVSFICLFYLFISSTLFLILEMDEFELLCGHFRISFVIIFAVLCVCVCFVFIIWNSSFSVFSSECIKLLHMQAVSSWHHIQQLPTGWRVYGQGRRLRHPRMRAHLLTADELFVVFLHSFGSGMPASWFGAGFSDLPRHHWTEIQH